MKAQPVAKPGTNAVDPPPPEALLAAIVQSSSDAIISKDLDSIITSWNPAATRIFGYSAEAMVGRSIRALIPPDRQAEEDLILARIRAGERIENFETERLTADGRLIPLSVTISPVVDAAGRIVGASKIARDVSERQRLDGELRQSEHRFRMMADNIPQLAWMAGPDGGLFWYNRRWYAYTGTDFSQMQGWGWAQVHHPDHLERVADLYRQHLQSGEDWEDIFPLRGADGEFRWFLSRAVPIRDDQGRISCWFGTNTDITEQRDREQQIRLLMAEVNHRAKNMLAMIQALARRTASTDQSGFVERFEQRIQALAANQDLLITGNWSGAQIEDLVRTQLGWVEDLIGRRVHIAGPAVKLNPGPAETLGMALHELATNAAKHGALANDTGMIHIDWGLDEEEGEGCCFTLRWEESGGPPVAPPQRKGFGTTVTTQVPVMALRARIESDFAPAGFRWSLRCPAARVTDVRAARPAPAATPAADEPLSALASAHAVLVVEDETLVALELAETLHEAGFAVLGPAASVDEAMRLLDRNRCALAILDVNLGNGDTSVPVAERLRDEGVPFFVTSGYAMSQKDPLFQEARNFPKPVAAAEMIAAARAVLAAA